MLKKHNIKKVDVKPLSDNWLVGWHGMCLLNECKAKKGSNKRKKLESKKEAVLKKYGKNIMRTADIEKHCFLSIMSNVQTDIVNMFELGAGRGDWVMATEGAIRHQIVPTMAKSCRCLAVEGEPTHFKWTQTHISEQNINCICVHGAVTNKVGRCSFDVSSEPSNSYGQAIRNNSKNRKTAEVKSYTIDSLMEEYDFPKLDFIHMDIQGEEYNALLGADKALSNNKIDYLMVCTHGRSGKGHDEKNKMIKELMQKYDYKILIDIPPKHPTAIDTKLGLVVSDSDGLMLLASSS